MGSVFFCGVGVEGSCFVETVWFIVEAVRFIVEAVRFIVETVQFIVEAVQFEENLTSRYCQTPINCHESFIIEQKYKQEIQKK
ncbi:hypothetical protein V7124_24735 [Neobacillus niacini]|uniref:hypothetical protein n=1 Tax=Neobacillus niacini TaxID=86668 RepID=UPI00300084B7